MEQIIVPVLFGLLIESVVYYADEFAVKRNLDWRLIAALVTSIGASLVFEIDVFAEDGFVSIVPFIGSAFTGIIFARTANFAHNIIERVHK